jgi:phage-related protein
VRGFLAGLDTKTQIRFAWSIEQLCLRNTQARPPLVKHLAGKLWELREESATNIYRVRYVFFTGQRIVLLHGFHKKSQKTPGVRSTPRSPASDASAAKEARPRMGTMNDGQRSYQEWRDNLLANPEFQRLYAEETAKKEL